jgi:hypothetical protein
LPQREEPAVLDELEARIRLYDRALGQKGGV